MHESTDSQDRGNPETEVLRPRHSLKVKACATVTLLIMISTCLCGYLTMLVGHAALQTSLERNAEVITRTANQIVSKQFSSGQEDQLGELLARMAFDSRVAFVMVTDVSEQMLARNISDPDAWHLYTTVAKDGLSLRSMSANTRITLTNNEGIDLLIDKQPIWQNAKDDPHHSPHPEISDSTGQIYGYIMVALRDPEVIILKGNIRTATIIVVGVVMLFSLPVVLWIVERWTKPLRKLLDATWHLQMNKLPTPVEVTTHDEIAALACAFNVMAEKLFNIHRELEEANQHLEEKVTQRTSELELANRHLQQDMDDKDEFIRAVSHDLNAPLRNITGMTKMLLSKYDNDLTEDVLSKLQRIAANANAETELLGDLLELSRIKSQPGKIQAVDLRAQIEQISQILSYEFENKGIELVIDSKFPTVSVNRNRIRQVFQNLIDNAIKYMPDDAPVKRIEVGAETRTGQKVFYVRDTGGGIAEKDHKRIFQVFQRARYSGTENIGGRGVGLATVKSIVESCGGEIWVESESGDGATFLFTLGTNHLCQNITTMIPSEKMMT